MTDKSTQTDDGDDADEEYITKREAEKLIDKRVRELERDLSRAMRGR